MWAEFSVLGIAPPGFLQREKREMAAKGRNNIPLLQKRAGNMLSRGQLRVARSQDALQMFRFVSLSRPSPRTYLRTAGPRIARTAASRELSYLTPSRLHVPDRANKRLRLSYSYGTRLNSTASAAPPASTKKEEAFQLVDKIYTQHEQILDDLESLSLIDDDTPINHFDLTGPVTAVIGHRNQHSLEASVRLARQQFGESLPPGELSEEEFKLYKLLYGDPIDIVSEVEAEAETAQEDKNALLKEDGEGGWTKVDLPVENADSASSEQGVATIENGAEEEIMDRARQVAESLGAELSSDYPPEDEQLFPLARGHPLTKEGKFGPKPSTVFLPGDTAIKPISRILDRFANKHLDEAAFRVFGGKDLPDALLPIKNHPDSPVAFSASEQNMSPMDAALFMGVLYPGLYASAMSALVEVRKRLGTEWIRGLIEKKGGPSILDAGSAGAGVLAWRDIIKAEWSLMFPDRPEGSKVLYGKSTVLTGSDTLRHAASALLENTTFLPRLPNYIHMDGDASKNGGERKSYDIIFAPHTLLNFQQDYQRKNYVQNLWTMLNPLGGVLILLEKGHKAGFTAVGGAREMILDKLIFSPESSSNDTIDEPHKSSDARLNFPTKGKGMIIAPCTNHSTCPMYVDPNNSQKKSKESCRFESRYVRPQFLQRLMGQSSVNFDDVRFSYLAVQRGIDQRELREITQGPAATDAAFAGYEDQHNDETSSASDEAAKATPKADPLTFPRLIMPPLKRKGHVIMDVCTPAGRLERWNVPRSFSKQAYRDARKSSHGDLWALGAKTRVHRPTRIHLTPKLKSRDAIKSEAIFASEHRHKRKKMEKNRKAANEPTDLEQALQSNDTYTAPVERDFIKPMVKPADTTPSWMKKLMVKRERRATKGPQLRKGSRSKGSEDSEIF